MDESGGPCGGMGGRLQRPGSPLHPLHLHLACFSMGIAHRSLTKCVLQNMHTETRRHMHAFAKLDFKSSWVGRRELMTPTVASLGHCHERGGWLPLAPGSEPVFLDQPQLGGEDAVGEGGEPGSNPSPSPLVMGREADPLVLQASIPLSAK